MMGLARLPVAPRPYRDELLSSWMARVACRYGLTAPDLADYFGDLLSPLHIDDGAPAAGQTRVWAQICGVDPDRVFRLSLRWRYPRRTRAWYASRGPEWMPSTVTGSTPVCLVCFADDQSAGRDGYLRACWMFAERCICPAHGELMLDRCRRATGVFTWPSASSTAARNPPASLAARFWPIEEGRAVGRTTKSLCAARLPSSNGSRKGSIAGRLSRSSWRTRFRSSGRRSTIQGPRGPCWRCGSTKWVGAAPTISGMPSASNLRSAS